MKSKRIEKWNVTVNQNRERRDGDGCSMCAGTLPTCARNFSSSVFLQPPLICRVSQRPRQSSRRALHSSAAGAVTPHLTRRAEARPPGLANAITPRQMDRAEREQVEASPLIMLPERLFIFTTHVNEAGSRSGCNKKEKKKRKPAKSDLHLENRKITPARILPPPRQTIFKNGFSWYVMLLAERLWSLRWH